MSARNIRRGARRLMLCTSSLIVFAIHSTYVQAQALSPDDLVALRQEVQALRVEQAAAASRIADLEQALANATSEPTRTVASTPVRAPAVTSVASAAAAAPQRLTFQGDLRLRYENNFSDADARDRERGVLRARVRANYLVNDRLSLGAQLATGDPDDPNSTDITLTGFNDDFEVSLDQVFMRAQFGDVVLHGGKIPQPFIRTELVWDGDVSPSGVSAAYTRAIGGGATLKASSLYFVVDESAAGRDSTMVGAQVSVDTGPNRPWRFELAGGYFDYNLGSISGADSGDFRGNLLRPDGRYLSDFDLVDVLATATYQGFGSRWPVKVVADYVQNRGAATDADTGYGVDLLVGRASTPGDWRFGYGYAVAETDAVFAAFSHDNTNLSTNYRQHTALFDYVPAKNVILNATYYVYRPEDVLHAGLNDPDDWLHRLRLNVLVNF